MVKFGFILLDMYSLAVVVFSHHRRCDLWLSSNLGILSFPFLFVRDFSLSYLER